MLAVPVDGEPPAAVDFGGALVVAAAELAETDGVADPLGVPVEAVGVGVGVGVGVVSPSDEVAIADDPLPSVDGAEECFFVDPSQPTSNAAIIKPTLAIRAAVRSSRIAG